ncbi:FxDxF family PEP-CTERM protein [Duganella callida]|uniref:PEP-CTERM sorting domain-containing protein n=1 Tax=Duganella callida TaxID=2561932 RepID=A0A4Y9SPH7_9BURK|nr:FxDxF family PEP-CTERM protein [Duganella callida]TFW27387.1 PEP-CTERM sorting domain-containing protein [Duganella callida]
MQIALPKSSSAIQFLLLAALPIGAATAADFPGTITGASTKPQTLAAGQSGTVAASGSLIVSGKDNAVTVSGNNVTLNNQGTIKQTGTGRVIRDNTGVQTLVINNGLSLSDRGALMQSADGDVFQAAQANASVTLNNYGSMISLNASAGGAQAVDLNAVTGANTVNNWGLLKATEADAVRPGLNGIINNWGTIQSVTSTGSSDGVDLQANTGIQVLNKGGGLIEGGRHGITGGPDGDTAFKITVINDAGGVIRGMNGSGLNLDGYSSKQVLYVTNDGTITGNGISGDGDGIDQDGIAYITNRGIIRSLNAMPAAGETRAYSEGISVGGGSIGNYGTIEGLVGAGNTIATGRGITLAGNDVKGAPEGTREGLYGNAVITNFGGGLIRGQNDAAIVVVGATNSYTVTINNQAGASIVGGGTRNAAIVGNGNNTTIITAGTIDGASSGKAIALGGGVNRVTINGGVINGSIDGGGGGQNTLMLNPGAGNGFAYSGAIANFSRVEVLGGQVILSGQSSYAGATWLSGGTLILAGANRLSADGKLVLNGGTLQLSGAGVDGQSFASLSLLDSSSVLLGGSTLTFGALGIVVDGKTLNFTEAAGGQYAFRLLGDYSADAGFLALLGATHINGQGVSYAFDGTYTEVLAAVPEPSTYAMLFAGLALVGAVARRRNAKA